MELNQFLVKAKINTYAKEGENNEIILENGSKSLSYKEDNFKYQDIYFGFNPFIGEEIVWENETLIWGMNYYGGIISKIVSTKEIYGFLRKALKKVEKEMPFRGPKQFKEKEFEYINNYEGDIENFKGTEMIKYQRELVYQLEYRGGLIKK